MEWDGTGTFIVVFYFTRKHAPFVEERGSARPLMGARENLRGSVRVSKPRRRDRGEEREGRESAMRNDEWDDNHGGSTESISWVIE
jgi:hypothetical protein